MPVMKPSTTCLARRSSWAMRAMVSGCRKRRGSSWILAATMRSRWGYVGQAAGLPSACENSMFAEAFGRPAAYPTEESTGEDLLEALVARQFALLVRRLLQEA